jgi:TPR repeat protein
LASLYQDDQDRLHYEDGLRTRAEAEAEAAYELGAALAFSGELPEARRWLQRAVDAGVASASLQLGELETELGNNTPAMRHFKAAAQADDSVGMVRLARLLLKQEDTDTAEKWLKLAYSQGSNAAAAYLAVLHDKAGNRQAADEWLERAGDGEDVDCLLGRAELAARRGADADASQLFIRAANGGSTRALLEVITPFSRPEPDRAAFWLEVAATWSPLVAAVYAALMARMNHFDEAKDAADSAAEAGMIMAKRHLVDVLMSKGDTEQAEAICREVLTDTRDPIDAFNLAVVCSERGDAEEALHYYRTAADGGMVMAKVNLAGMLVKSGNVDEAMSLLDAAINRGNTDAFAMRGLIAETGGDLAGAEQWYRRAQSASSSAAQRLAKISLDRDDTEAAITALLPSATDGNPQSATRLALIYDEKIGDAESAEHWYRSAATRGNDIAAYKLAKIHANRGEDELAERWLRRAVEDGSGIAAHDIGELMLGRGLLAAAEEWYRKSFELGHIDAAFDVGTMMAALNRNEDAQYWWATGIARRDLGVSVDELIANHKISVLVTRDPNDTGKKVYVISI